MSNGDTKPQTVVVTGAGANGTPGPDPLANPEYFSGVLWRRVVAYWIDIVVIIVIMGALYVPALFLGVLSLGVLWPPLMILFALVPLLYHAALIGGPRSATVGMRTMGLEVLVRDGGRPDFIRAAALALLFYLSIMLTQWLILLVTLFNQEKRTLHDMICGTIVVNVLRPRTGTPP